MTAGDLPALEEVLGYFTTCRNWERWGAEDQLGTLNYITDEHRRAAAALVTAGRAVGLSRLIPTRTSPPDLRPAPCTPCCTAATRSPDSPARPAPDTART